MILVGDFNETLRASEGSSGYLNRQGSWAFRNLIFECDLMEYPLQGHRFTWFRGKSKSRIDRAFASPAVHQQFISH